MNVKFFDSVSKVKMPLKPNETPDEEFYDGDYIVTVPNDEFMIGHWSFIYTFPPRNHEDHGYYTWELNDEGELTGGIDDPWEEEGRIEMHCFYSFEDAKKFRDLARLEAQIRLIEQEWGYHSYARDVFEAVSRLSRRK